MYFATLFLNVSITPVPILPPTLFTVLPKPVILSFMFDPKSEAFPGILLIPDHKSDAMLETSPKPKSERASFKALSISLSDIPLLERYLISFTI